MLEDFDFLFVAVDGNGLASRADINAKSALEGLGGLDNKGRALGNFAADVIRQTAIGEADIFAAFEENDFGFFAEPSGACGAGSASGDSADNDEGLFHGFASGDRRPPGWLWAALRRGGEYGNYGINGTYGNYGRNGNYGINGTYRNYGINGTYRNYGRNGNYGTNGINGICAFCRAALSANWFGGSVKNFDKQFQFSSHLAPSALQGSLSAILAPSPPLAMQAHARDCESGERLKENLEGDNLFGRDIEA